MNHAIDKCPTQHIRKQLTKEPICEQRFSRNKISFPIRQPRFHQHHYPQTGHSKYVKRSTVQAS